jgi:anti-anti-sigma factor
MNVHQVKEVIIIDIVNEDCQILMRTVEPILADGKRAFVFNMAQAKFLNSLNIAAIIATRNKIMASNGNISICNLSPNIKAVFRILKLERFFNLELDLDGAIIATK